MLNKTALMNILFPNALLLASGLTTTARAFYDPGEILAGSQRGFVTGRASDSEGKPLEGVKIIIDHSIFYNSIISTGSDARGNYRARVPTGSWYAFAEMRKSYNGRTYKFYLEPDFYEGFGVAGAVRNFVWRLSGEAREPLAPGRRRFSLNLKCVLRR